MSKKQLERQAKYLNFLKEIKRLYDEGTNPNPQELASQYGIPLYFIPILQKKGIMSKQRISGSKSYEWSWNTIQPNVYMVKALLEESSKAHKKYYNYKGKNQVESVKIVNEAPKTKRTFSFLFGLIKFNY